MNTPISTEAPPNVEQQMEVLWARIEEKMSQIRRDREEGEAIMSESHRISQNNARALEELGELMARMR